MPDRSEPPTLKDVAARAGVSVKTVSNVVNGYPFISSATRERVQQAVDELGYRPNLAARGLRSGRSGVVALAVPELRMAYFAELAHFVVQAAAARGWTVVVEETGGSADRERAAALSRSGALVDGLLLSPLALSDDEIRQYATETALVLLGERPGPGLADHVAIDNTAAARAATAHLLDAGRERVAVVGAQSGRSSHTAALRLAGHRAALEERGLQVHDELLVRADEWHRQDGAEGVRRLLALDRPPDAVFCFNDLLALGALRALREAGVRVPDDVAVVGFDDIEESRYSSPSLTTVSPDKAGIAATAVEMLADRLGPGRDGPARSVSVGHELVVRESSLSPAP
ncbi:DNA-binding LacI/PurR family transcriptional regulator [Motilibacter peucedani]|uniref:DNA-binding LacI/PurR family transcriptional regulator n=1 Tax=Motilibacter peucedani TaxID=598650 RepID=A0A420XN93_9ACTN|nr:LacI family DNA-binding transcriptional regulator [Motilibacter peucedani]RKS72735.1 DNA-binding LacI/PurR family transcriptional regulator [Motilibacter peucedani]